MKVRSSLRRQLFRVKYSKCAVLSACEKGTLDGNRMDKGGNEAQSGKWSFCHLISILLASDGGMQLVTVGNEARATGRLLIPASDGDGTSPGGGAGFSPVASAAGALSASDAALPPLPRCSLLPSRSFHALHAPDAADVSCVK